MDETCKWLEKLINLVDCCGPPRIPYVGRALGGIRNPPAPHVEISYLLEGYFDDLKIGEKKVQFSPGQVALLNVHQGNYSPTMQKIDSWCVFLDTEGVGEFDSLEKEPLFCTVSVRQQEALIAAFEKLTIYCQRFGTGPSAYLTPEPLYDHLRDREYISASIHIKGALLELLAVILDEAQAVDALPVLKPAAIQSAIEYINLHYQDSELNLKDIARAASLSIDHFGRLFREHTGETPMRFLKRIRIRQSQYFLEFSNLLIEEIACEVGFKDPFHFSRVFKEVSGQSPRSYRQEYRLGVT